MRDLRNGRGISTGSERPARIGVDTTTRVRVAGWPRGRVLQDQPYTVMTFTQAVARMEGYYVSGTRPARNFNPGDIEYGRFAVAHGATGTDGRFAVFPDEATGFAAMRALFQAHSYAGLTIAQAIAKWAPPNENDTERYTSLVCQWTGLTPSTVIDGCL